MGLKFWKQGVLTAQGLCTGTTLSQHWIVTSAHCINGMSSKTHRVEVLSGDDTVYNDSASFRNHPDYDGEQDAGDDLGLVRLHGEGLVPYVPAKIEIGVTFGDPLKLIGRVFFVAGYGLGTDQGTSSSCDAPSAAVETKRLGRFRLAGGHDDNGVLGFGGAIAVNARFLRNRLCDGDSGAAWAFASNDQPRNELRVFAVHHGHADRIVGDDRAWGTLIRPKLRWVTDKTASDGVPLDCPATGESGRYSSFRRCTEGYWMMSSGASRDPRRLHSLSTPLAHVTFGDFDGDGRAGDAFLPAFGEWLVFFANRRDWTHIRENGGSLNSLGFGDFDGNGTTDVFRVSSGSWQVLLSAPDPSDWGTWINNGPSLGSFSQLRFGDFDGDGLTDVVRSNGGQLQVSFRAGSGFNRWADMKSSNIPVDRLRFADFDGDGASDAFRRTPEAWFVSYAAKDRTRWTLWQQVQSSQMPLSALGFGDFNGDGTTDVFRADAGVWYASYSTKDRSQWSSWRVLNRSDVQVSEITFADVDGNKKSEAIFAESVVPASR